MNEKLMKTGGRRYALSPLTFYIPPPFNKIPPPFKTQLNNQKNNFFTSNFYEFLGVDLSNTYTNNSKRKLCLG